MGTRSLTRFFDENDDKKPFAVVYRQFDGYPDGHGLELAEFLAKRTVVNGFNTQTAETHANGMGCLAAQMVKLFKEDIGNVYLTYDGDHGQDYTYDVRPTKKGPVKLSCKGYRDEIFNGSPLEFIAKYSKAKETA
jgi:hypothetical protein